MAALHGTFGFDVFWRLTCGGKCTRQKRAAPCALSGTEGPLPCTVFAVLCARWGRSRDGKCTRRPLLWPGPSGSVHGGDAPVTKSVRGGDACGHPPIWYGLYCMVLVRNTAHVLIYPTACTWQVRSQSCERCTMDKRGQRWQYLSKRRAAALRTPAVRLTASSPPPRVPRAPSAVLLSFRITCAPTAASTRTARSSSPSRARTIRKPWRSVPLWGVGLLLFTPAGSAGLGRGPGLRPAGNRAVLRRECHDYDLR